MANVLAIDWDSSDIRCVLASTAGKKFKILLATSVPLVNVAETAEQQAPDVGGSLRAVLGNQKIGRATTVVGVDRASLEMLYFTVPPASDAELAVLVQNLVMRESPNLVEDGQLDFIPLSDDPAEPRAVMAAALSRTRCREIQDICAAAGLKATRIVLRPFAAASYFLAAVPAAEQACLLVNVLAEEVDMTVLVDGRPLLLRTVRAPAGVAEEEVAQRLKAEISRTLVVAQQGPAGKTIERIYLFGGPGEHQTLADTVNAELEIPLTVLDPFESVDDSSIEVPGNAGRFAALLGMVQDEAHGAHALDFLHPRRPPVPPNRRRMALIVGGLLALLAMVGGSLYWDAITSLQDANRELTQQRKELDATLKHSRRQAQLFASVRDWKAADVVWLDELRDLSLRLPPSRDLLVQRMTISGGRSGGGVIEMQGIARNAAVIAELDRTLHDEYHTVSSKRVSDSPQGNGYSWIFERTISVSPREKSLYLPEKPAAP